MGCCSIGAAAVFSFLAANKRGAECRESTLHLAALPCALFRPALQRGRLFAQLRQDAGLCGMLCRGLRSGAHLRCRQRRGRHCRHGLLPGQSFCFGLLPGLLFRFVLLPGAEPAVVLEQGQGVFVQILMAGLFKHCETNTARQK